MFVSLVWKQLDLVNAPVAPWFVLSASDIPETLETPQSCRWAWAWAWAWERERGMGGGSWRQEQLPPDARIEHVQAIVSHDSYFQSPFFVF